MEIRIKSGFTVKTPEGVIEYKAGQIVGKDVADAHPENIKFIGVPDVETKSTVEELVEPVEVIEEVVEEQVKESPAKKRKKSKR